MTKNNEIKILKAAAAKLGTDSYMGPWLTSALPFIESSIRADMPFYTVEEMTKQSQKIEADADRSAKEKIRKANEILEQANAKAAQIVKDARQKANDLFKMTESREALNRAADRVRRIARDLDIMANNAKL